MDKLKELLEKAKVFALKHKKYWPYAAVGALSLVLIILVIVAFSVSGPSDVPTDPPAITTTAPTTAPTTVPTTPTTVPTVPTTAPELNYTHPLTGEAIAEPMLSRPIAVMLNNINVAMPQHGVSQADILYEVLAEGGITRCMGIFTNIEKVEALGSLRSARKYYIDIALGYGAAYLHAGGSPEALNYLTTIRDINLDAGASATHFYRDQNRLNAGYSLEHTLFTSGEKLLDFAQVMKITTDLKEETDYGMTFDDDKVIKGEDAKKVSVYFNQGGNPSAWTKSTIFTLDKDTNTYFAEQHGGDYIDGNTKKAISFRNIVVIKAKTSLQEDGLHLTINTLGSGEGYFAANGQIVPITWSRSSYNEPFTFTMENGEEVTYGVGTTYIGVIPSNGTVTYE